jgi:DNA-binding CsgD family transcriptional regulator
MIIVKPIFLTCISKVIFNMIRALDIRFCRKNLIPEAEQKVISTVGEISHERLKMLNLLMQSLMTGTPLQCMLAIFTDEHDISSLKNTRHIISSHTGNYDWNKSEPPGINKILNTQELKVFRLLCSGYSARQIEEATGIKYNYVRSLTSDIYEKTRCHSIQELIYYKLGRI